MQSRSTTLHILALWVDGSWSSRCQTLVCEFWLLAGLITIYDDTEKVYWTLFVLPEYRDDNFKVKEE